MSEDYTEYQRKIGIFAQWLQVNATLEKELVDKETSEEFIKAYEGRDKDLKEELALYMASCLYALGGANRLNVMINAREFRLLPTERGGLAFKFSGHPEKNYLEVVVGYNDYYVIRSHYLRAGKLSKTEEIRDIYVGDLKSTIEQHLQLYLSF